MKSRMQKSAQTRGFRPEIAILHTEHRASDRPPTFVMVQAPVSTSLSQGSVGLLLRSPQMSGSNLVWALATCVLWCLPPEASEHVGQSTGNSSWGRHFSYAEQMSPQ